MLPPRNQIINLKQFVSFYEQEKLIDQSYTFHPVSYLCWWRKACAAFALQRCSLCPRCCKLIQNNLDLDHDPFLSTHSHRHTADTVGEKTTTKNNTGTQPQLSPSPLQCPPPDTGVHFPFGGRQYPPHHFEGQKYSDATQTDTSATVTQHTSSARRPEETPFFCVFVLLTQHIEEGGSCATWSL